MTSWWSRCSTGTLHSDVAGGRHRPFGGVDVSREAVIGSILGTAVGDAIGLPYEGLSP